ncbi:MAG: hypothetical protein WA990_03795 [Rubrobacteraceae bacterium]
MSQRSSDSSAEGVLNLLGKVEVRLEKARNEAAGLRWHKRLNLARRVRLSRYGKQLAEVRQAWRNGDSTTALTLLQTIDLRYPSVLGLVYVTPRKRENRREVYEIEQEEILKRENIPPGPLGGFHGGGPV